MTLILTAASSQFVIQISDRRLTLIGRGKEFDPIANKTVVYRASNAFVTMGYAGIAYIDNIPTDEWIVQCLTGQPVRDAKDGEASIHFGRNSSGRTIDQAVHHLRGALDRRPAPKRYGLAIAIGGWKTVRQRTFSFIAELEWRRQAKLSTLTFTPRPWLWQQSLCFSHIGANAVDVLQTNIAKQHRSDPTTISNDQVEGLLVQTLRKTALCDSTVGPNILSVTLAKPEVGLGWSRFIPATQHLAAVDMAARKVTVPVAHSPWIVGPSLTYPPSMQVGQMTVGLGKGVDFLICGEPKVGSIAAMSSSINRPLPPS